MNLPPTKLWYTSSAVRIPFPAEHIISILFILELAFVITISIECVPFLLIIQLLSGSAGWSISRLVTGGKELWTVHLRETLDPVLISDHIIVLVPSLKYGPPIIIDTGILYIATHYTKKMFIYLLQKWYLLHEHLLVYS